MDNFPTLMISWIAVLGGITMLVGFVYGLHIAIRPIALTDLGPLLMIALPLGWHFLTSSGAIIPVVLVSAGVGVLIERGRF